MSSDPTAPKPIQREGIFCMGKRYRMRRQAFFDKHPMCCFCGGKTPAVEIDHIPARHLFAGRQWPEGYEFPACAACNDESAEDELVMGFLVRIQLSNMSADEEKELERAVWNIGDRHPELLKGMRELSRIETRRFLREQGVSITSFPWEPYVVTVPEMLMDVPKRYGEKLGKALYYMHTGQIIPKDGFVSVSAMTNTQFMSPKFPIERFTILDRKPILARSGKSLEKQFAYRYAVPEDGGGAAFLVQFRESTAMLILAHESMANYEAIKAKGMKPNKQECADPL